MFYSKKYIISIVFCIMLSITNGQDMAFFHYGLEDGLSQQTIRCILKDSRGFLWLGTQDGLNRFDGHAFKIYKPILNDSTSISGKFINDIEETKDGTIWIASSNYGVCYYNPTTDTFVKTALNTGNCTSLISDKNGNIYATFLSKGLVKFSKEDTIYTHNFLSVREGIRPSITSSHINKDTLYLGTTDGKIFTCSLEKNSPKFRPISHGKSLGIIHEINSVNNLLLIGSANGLYELKNQTLQYINLKQFNTQLSENLFIESIATSTKDLYVGTDNGLFVIKDYCTEGYNSNKVNVFNGDKNYSNSITSNRVYDIVVDDNLLWIGTNNLDVATLTPPVFKTINTLSKPAINNSHVYSILKTKDYLFIGTRDGLNCIDKNGYVFNITKENTNQQLSYNVIRGMCIDAHNNLWLATTKGVSVINLKDFDPNFPNIVSFYFEEDNPLSLSSNKTRSIFLDHNDQIWIATYGGGINRFTGDLKGKVYRFERYKTDSNNNSISSDYTFHINQDKDLNYWITSENGLNKLSFESHNYKNPVFKTYKANDKNPKDLQNNTTLHTHLDTEGRLWIATQNGLHLYNKKEDSFKHYNENNGLSNTYVYAIVEDNDQKLWVSTNDGLFRFNKSLERFTQFTLKDGIQSTEFNLGAYHYDKNTNQLYFGGVNGYNAFNPNNLASLDAEGQLITTEFRINNNAVNPISRKDVLSNAITKTNDLNLQHTDFPCTIQFSDLDLRPQKNTKFVYRLNSEDWSYASNNQQIELVKLPKGTHVLELQGESRGKLWERTPLKLNIHVIPPWYKSNMAYLCYLLLFFGLVTAFYRIMLQRKLAGQESKRLQDLDALKSRFITNITHEFRTPLTLIMGYAETLKEKLNPSSTAENALKSIEKNSNHLLTLVNEMMDLAKLERGRLALNNTKQDIVKYTLYLVDSFSSLIENKNIKLHFSSDIEVLEMDFDVEKYRQIISNLISNAIKFSDEDSSITLGLKSTNHQLKIEVKDEGKGILEKDLPYIFDRFYQAQNNNDAKIKGSGVGLALTKELVSLMDGSINVNSVYGHGTTFTLHLPITTNDINKPLILKQPKNTTTFKSDIPELKTKKQKHNNTILIVEDNKEIAKYISTCLEDDYNLKFAENGEVGLKKAKKGIPDIIITDVMMPKMHGFQLTKALQEDTSTNHIPIIILTAKGQQDAKLEGYEVGADAYLTKPFQKTELILRVKKLIDKRATLQAFYSQKKVITLQSSEIKNDKKLQFLDLVVQQINDHIDNSEFNASKLAESLGLSESQLYRKLKAITNKSTALYIRSVRLEKAKSLLEQTDLSISEIAYATGFSNPNWFGKAFKEEFGLNPSEAR